MIDFFANIDFGSIQNLIMGLFGGGGIVGVFAYKKLEKRLKEAEVRSKELENEDKKYDIYEERLTHANQVIDGHNQTLLQQGQTIADLNRALDDKTKRIRDLTDDLYKSEQDKNDLNRELVQKTALIGKLQLCVEKYQMWKCENAECVNRIPPNPQLRGKSFERCDSCPIKDICSKK